MAAFFLGNLAAERASAIYGNGEQTQDYIHVFDVARANELALEGHAAPGGLNNIATGIETSVKELYSLLREISGKGLPPKHGPGNPASGQEAS